MEPKKLGSNCTICEVLFNLGSVQAETCLPKEKFISDHFSLCFFSWYMQFLYSGKTCWGYIMIMPQVETNKLTIRQYCNSGHNFFYIKESVVTNVVAVWYSEPAQETERPLHKPLELYCNVHAFWLHEWGECCTIIITFSYAIRKSNACSQHSLVMINMVYY